MTMKNREEMISLLVAEDIIAIQQGLAVGDYSYLCSVLDGEDFVPYAQMSPEVLMEEFTERFQDIRKNQQVLDLASYLFEDDDDE